MANDISGINSNRSQQTSDRNVTSSRKSDKSEADTRSSVSEPASRDKVSLTDTAERLKALEEQLAKQPEIDRDRVSDVQNALVKGEYKVNPNRVADKMMNFEASFSKQS